MHFRGVSCIFPEMFLDCRTTKLREPILTTKLQEPYPDHKRWVPHCPDFLRRLVALTHFMRLSLMKGAHADLSSTAWQEIGVKPSVGLSGIPRSLTARPQWGEKLLGKTKRPVTVANKVITPPVAAPSPPVPAAPPPLPAAQRSLLPSEPYSSPSQRTRQPPR
jgi:hypothetical protein